MVSTKLMDWIRGIREIKSSILRNNLISQRILWMLDFTTKRRIKSLGTKIGRSLQAHGHRTLNENDVVLLESYSERFTHI